MSHNLYQFVFDNIINTNNTDDYKISLLKECLDFGIDINYNGQQLLMSAIFSHNIEIVKFLLSKNIHTNNLILNKACNNLEIMKLLIEYGADISNMHDELLLSAIKFNNFYVVEYLLNNGASCSEKNIVEAYKLPHKTKIDNTRINNLGIMELLLKSGANPNSKCDDGLVLLEYSIMNYGWQESDLLIKYKADTKLCLNFINKTPIVKEYVRGQYKEYVQYTINRASKYDLDISWLLYRRT